MRALVQRVLSARVDVEGKTVSQVGPGLLVFVGIADSDVDADSQFICRKILNMRLFTNEKTGKAWDQSGEPFWRELRLNSNFLYSWFAVSQFTLFGIMKGNKPDFHIAMPPTRAEPFYNSFVDSVSNAYNRELVKDGIFGAMMQIHLINDGPVTMHLDSRKAVGSEENE